MDFPCDFIAVRESYSPPENPASILLRLDWGRTKLAARCRHFREKSRCAAMTFRRISIEIRILYVHFGKCLSDVDKIAFSAFRTRFSASEYRYHPSQNREKKSLRRNDFWGSKCVSMSGIAAGVRWGVPAAFLFFEMWYHKNNALRVKPFPGICVYIGEHT